MPGIKVFGRNKAISDLNTFAELESVFYMLVSLIQQIIVQRPLEILVLLVVEWRRENLIESIFPSLTEVP